MFSTNGLLNALLSPEKKAIERWISILPEYTSKLDCRAFSVCWICELEVGLLFVSFILFHYKNKYKCTLLTFITHILMCLCHIA